MNSVDSTIAGRQASFSFGKRLLRFRMGRGIGVSAVAVAAACCLFAGRSEAEEAKPELPGFLFEPFYASNSGVVYGVYSARHADLVLISGGFDAGFQSGMICRIQDGAGEVGEVILVEVRENCAAGLILELAGGNTIQPGHAVTTKTVVF